MTLYRRQSDKTKGKKAKEKRSQAGTVLIVVLLAMALLTAMIVEFAYGIYVSTSAVYNWADLQKASVLAESGVALGKAAAKGSYDSLGYTYFTELSYPVPEPFPGEEGSITYTLEDETGKLNVNRIVTGQNDASFIHDALQRLCLHLDVPQAAVDIIRDWIDPDDTPQVRGGEEGAKNAELWSLSELYEIPMLDREWVDALIPYLTIHGDEFGRINLNAASRPVLISLFETDQSEQYADEIISWREKYGGITTDGNASLAKLFNSKLPDAVKNFAEGLYLVKGTHFRLTCTGEIGEIKRTIEAVIDVPGGYKIKSWREY